jgi:hypothetical protein
MMRYDTLRVELWVFIHLFIVVLSLCSWCSLFEDVVVGGRSCLLRLQAKIYKAGDCTFTYILTLFWQRHDECQTEVVGLTGFVYYFASQIQEKKGRE